MRQTRTGFRYTSFETDLIFFDFSMRRAQAYEIASSGYSYENLRHNKDIMINYNVFCRDDEVIEFGYFSQKIILNNHSIVPV